MLLAGVRCRPEEDEEKLRTWFSIQNDSGLTHNNICATFLNIRKKKVRQKTIFSLLAAGGLKKNLRARIEHRKASKSFSRKRNIKSRIYFFVVYHSLKSFVVRADLFFRFYMSQRCIMHNKNRFRAASCDAGAFFLWPMKNYHIFRIGWGAQRCIVRFQCRRQSSALIFYLLAIIAYRQWMKKRCGIVAQSSVNCQSEIALRWKIKIEFHFKCLQLFFVSSAQQEKKTVLRWKEVKNCIKLTFGQLSEISNFSPRARYNCERNF